MWEPTQGKECGRKAPRKRKLDIEKLKQDDIRREYQAELTNRFALLEHVDEWDEVKDGIYAELG